MFKLPNTLLRILGTNTNVIAQYEAGFLSPTFGLTEKGKRALLQILAVKFETELSARAKQLNDAANARTANGTAPVVDEE